MESRFGLKDLVVVVLLLAILVSIWLAMGQYDRQWDVLQRIERGITEQSQALAKATDAMRQAAARQESFSATPQPTTVQSVTQTARVPGSDTQPPSPSVDPFYRLTEPRDDPGFAFGDWFVDMFRSTVGKLTPLIAGDAYQSAIEAYVLESLITRDPETLEWMPWIATDWSISEDGLQITYNLRHDVTFSDGEPLTAEDVVFTYNMIMNPEINAPRVRVYYENVTSVEALGPYQVRFTLGEPYFMSLSITGGLAIMPKHYYEQFSPEEFNTMPGLLVGSGPYRLDVDPEQWTPGSGRIELVRNERYWGPRPTFDRLVWKEITDENAGLAAFRNREVDRFGVTALQYPKLSKDEMLLKQAELYEYETAVSGYRYIGWNQQRGGKATPFADKRVRRAMTLLLDRQRMADTLLNGLGKVMSGPFNPLSKQASPDVKPMAHDPEQAKQLLADAGYADRDGDGVLEGPDGTPFRFKLIYPSGSADYRAMVFAIKDMLARAGVVVEPDPLEWTIMLQRIDQRDFDAITLGWTAGIEGDPKQIFHSEAIAGGGDNYVNYSNPELDAIIDEARVTMDEAKRMELWHEAHRILNADQPYTFLFTQKSVVFIDRRVRNVEVTTTGLNERTEYFVPAELQLYDQ